MVSFFNVRYGSSQGTATADNGGLVPVFTEISRNLFETGRLYSYFSEFSARVFYTVYRVLHRSKPFFPLSSLAKQQIYHHAYRHIYVLVLKLLFILEGGGWKRWRRKRGDCKRKRMKKGKMKKKIKLNG